LQSRITILFAVFAILVTTRVGAQQFTAATSCDTAGVAARWDHGIRLSAGFPPDTVNHRRAAIIGAASGGIIGGLGSAAFILNAVGTECVRNVSDNSGCPGHSHIVFHAATITAGTVVGALAGAWLGRRIAGWWAGQHRAPAS
jgi:hypothetical protein